MCVCVCVCVCVFARARLSLSLSLPPCVCVWVDGRTGVDYCARELERGGGRGGGGHREGSRLIVFVVDPIHMCEKDNWRGEHQICSYVVRKEQSSTNHT